MLKLTTEQLDHMDRIIETYKRKEEKLIRRGKDPYDPNATGSLHEVRFQHYSMAQGGCGSVTGEADNSTIRGKFYKGYPNEFFQRVCDRMRWPWPE